MYLSNKSGLTLAIFFILIISSLIKTHTTPAKEEFTFGAILPITGPAANLAKAQEYGLALAEGKLLSQIPYLEVITADSQLDGIVGKQVARRFMEQGVDVLYSSFTQVTREVTEVSLENEIPLFYDSCNCGFAGTNPHAFQLYVDPRRECADVGKIYKERGVLKAAYIGPDVPYGKYCYEALQNVFGTDNVIVEIEQEGIKKRHTSLLANLKGSGVGLMVSIPIAQGLTDILRANESTYSDIPFSCFAGQCLTKSVREGVSQDALSSITAFDFQIADDFITALSAEHPNLSQEEITAAAIAHDSLIYAATGHLLCSKLTASCIEGQSIKPVVTPAIMAKGFTTERILNYKSRYINSSFEEITL